LWGESHCQQSPEERGEKKREKVYREKGENFLTEEMHSTVPSQERIKDGKKD